MKRREKRRPRPCEGSMHDGRTVEAARRPRFVMMARRASSEDNTLRITACRHRYSQESSGDDKMAPYRVRARAPSSGSERRSQVRRPGQP